MELDGFCQARVGTTCTRRYGAISASQVQSSHYTVLRDVTYLFMGRCFSFTYFRRLFRRLYSQACSGTRALAEGGKSVAKAKGQDGAWPSNNPPSGDHG